MNGVAFWRFSQLRDKLDRRKKTVMEQSKKGKPFKYVPSRDSANLMKKERRLGYE